LPRFATNIEAHLGALGEAIVTGLLHRRAVDEHVLAAGVRLNEAIALL
jgi:hypothetical protein